ncbi:hypothetical protein ABIB40_002642 [Pedobacter sp. UYP30]|uniref:hypothetical protein n=1 Tax=Pedobacter sp. UYP30 TaxID=1756400 RepID=UPI00339AA983
MKNIKTMSFSIHIYSKREKIWSVLWNPTSYGKWTNVFTEGSHYNGELKQGNTIQFLRKDGGGMTTLIEKMVENEQMVFAHQKEIKNGVETDSIWQGAKEIYHLKTENNKQIELQVILDVTSEMEDYFMKIFPRALALVKQIAEQ